MQLLDIKRMAHNILENQNIESSFIEYKKSSNFKDKILKTACAFANNYMNNEIGLLFVGIEEVEDDGEPFEEKMTRLTSELSDMFAKSHELEDEIRKKLGAIGYEI